jgi:hypothetical protein
MVYVVHWSYPLQLKEIGLFATPSLLSVLSNLNVVGAGYMPKSAYYDVDNNTRLLNILEAPFFAKSDFNNLPAQNRISDLTINRGKGNDGAIGILFTGANNCQMSDLDIINEDMQNRSGVFI